MKTTHLLATFVAATLPLAAISAEDSSKTETTDQKQEQNSDMTGMKGMMGNGQMMSNWKDQDAELDKLVAEIHIASVDWFDDDGDALRSSLSRGTNKVLHIHR